MNANILLYPIFLPLVAGAVSLLLPGRKGVREGLALGVSIVTLLLGLVIFLSGKLSLVLSWFPQLNIDFKLGTTPLSSLILLFIVFFGFLFGLYSMKFIKGLPRTAEYYAYFLWTLGSSCGVVLSQNLVVFLLFWGSLGLLLYAFLSLGSSQLATRGIFTVGAGDFALILGMLFFYRITGTMDLTGIQKVSLTGTFPVITFILLIIGGLAKLGSIPFHTWIPQAAEEVPVPVMSYLPASLDKLLATYLLSRICLDFFSFGPESWVSPLLMVIGSFTLVVALMMALDQNDMRKILAFLNIGAAGYLIIALATGNSLGTVGGIFYLLNTSIWTACLFFTAGAVQFVSKTTELGRMENLVKSIPLISGCYLVAGLAVAGIPPLSGFFSKWMIYQGIVFIGQSPGTFGNLWIVWLVAAMFGSALTLAVVVKVFHSVFLFRTETHSSPLTQQPLPKVPLTMVIPIVILASLCVLFGVFAYQIPLKMFILDSVSLESGWIGWWQPALATGLIIIGLALGIIIYAISRVKLARESDIYIGGETATPETKVSGRDAYDTIREFPGLRKIYAAAEEKRLDIYRGSLAFARGSAKFLLELDWLVDYMWRGLAYLVLLAGEGISLLHTGVLHTYLAWSLLGLVVLLLLFLH